MCFVQTNHTLEGDKKCVLFTLIILYREIKSVFCSD